MGCRAEGVLPEFLPEGSKTPGREEEGDTVSFGESGDAGGDGGEEGFEHAVWRIA